MRKIRGKCAALLSALAIAACASSLAACSDEDDGGSGSYEWYMNVDDTITGGSISCFYYYENETKVKVVVTAEPGYTLEAVIVTKAGGGNVDVAMVDEGVYSFTAPNAEFTVSATFRENSDVAAATGSAAAGDVILSDGTRISASSVSAMSPAQVNKAVAVVFYSGSASGILGERTLAVGLNTSGSVKWALDKTDGEKNVESIKCAPSTYNANETAKTATFSGDTDGSDNWSALCEAVNDEADASNYPAWTWVNQYAAANSLSGAFGDGWYMPTVAELSVLYRAESVVNRSMRRLGKEELVSSFWSSSQSTREYAAYFAWAVDMISGKISDKSKSSKYSSEHVCAVRSL